MTGYELLNRLLPRLDKVEAVEGFVFIDALNAAVDLLFKRLVNRKSDLAKNPLSLELATNDSSKAMPADFRGFVERPYYGGTLLNPLKIEEEAAYNGIDPGKPKFYQLKGQTLHIYPATDAAIIIKGDYWAAPVTVVIGDALPYSGMFDLALQETVLQMAKDGIIPVLASQAFVIVLDRLIDDVVMNRNNVRRRVHAQFF